MSSRQIQVPGSIAIVGYDDTELLIRESSPPSRAGTDARPAPRPRTPAARLAEVALAGAAVR